MKEMDMQALKDLKDIYEGYLQNGMNKEITQKAKAIYDQYHPAGTLLDTKILSVVGKLFPIAYPEANSGLTPPDKSETEEILSLLEKLR